MDDEVRRAGEVLMRRLIAQGGGNAPHAQNFRPVRWNRIAAAPEL